MTNRFRVDLFVGVGSPATVVVYVHDWLQFVRQNIAFDKGHARKGTDTGRADAIRVAFWTSTAIDPARNGRFCGSIVQLWAAQGNKDTGKDRDSHTILTTDSDAIGAVARKSQERLGIDLHLTGTTPAATTVDDCIIERLEDHCDDVTI